jgi:lipopolysaccharide/colanic/teichoic acid biosynthesis glycosyltransferase
MSSCGTFLNGGLSQHLIDDDLINANDINIRKFRRKSMVKISASIAIILTALIILIIIIVVKKKQHPSPPIAVNRSIDLSKKILYGC